MITVKVKSNIDQVLAGMRGIQRDVVDKAVPAALNRVVEMARTQVARDIVADGYNFKIGEIKDAISITKASAGVRRVSMRVRRQTKSLMEFNPTESKAGVTVKVHKGRKLIKGAFIGQLQNGRYGVYIEDKTAGKTMLRRKKQYKRGASGGWHAYPVRKLFGPSVGGAFVNDRLQAALDRFVSEKFGERLTHEIKRLTR